MNTLTKNENRTQTQQPSETGQVTRERGFVTPQVNITESKDEYVLEAEMPGVTKDGLEVLLEGNELSIVGRRRSFEPPNAQLVYRESTPRDYRRTFVLDPAIDTSKIRAHMEQGVLMLHLPKAEKVKPRKIAIGE
jgi:HSP20 family protein